MIWGWYKSDAHCVRRILAGHREEFGILVDRYASVAHAVALARVKNHADADDVTQEAFLHALQALDRLRDISKFGPWFLTIVRNTATDLTKKRSRETALPENIEVLQGAIHPDIDQRELRELLRLQVLGLDEIHRDVLMIHYFGGKSVRETAALLESSEDAIKKRLQRAREALSVQLSTDLAELLRPEKPQEAYRKQVMGMLATVSVPWSRPGGSAFGTGLGGMLTGPLVAPVGVALVVLASASVGLFTYSHELARYWGYEKPPVATAQTNPTTQAPKQAPPSAPALAPAALQVAPSETETLRNTTGPGIVKGTVTMDGTSVSGAHVVLERIDWEKYAPPPAVTLRRETQTDAQGRYVFTGLPVAKFMLLATARDAAKVAPATLAPGTDLIDVPVALEPAGTIGGTVLDGAGRPVSGAWVYPWYCDQDPKEFFSGYSMALRAQTDATGRFAMPHLKQGQWKIEIKAPGYATLMTDYIAVGKQDEVFTLSHGGTASGVVVDAKTGAPMPGVNVYIPGLVRRDHFEVVSDAQGRFRQTGLLPGKYMTITLDKIYVSEKGWIDFAVEEGKETADIVVPVVKGALIEGRVYDADTGQGIAGVRVKVDQTTGISEPTDASGHYGISGLEGGTRTLLLENVSGYPKQQGLARIEVSLQTGLQSTGCDFALSRGPAVTGKVLDERGEPIYGVKVTGYGSDGVALDWTSSEANGTFSLVLPGHTQKATFNAEAPGLVSTDIGPLDLSKGPVPPIELRLAPEGGIEGIVTDPYDRPVAGWQVQVVSTDERGAVKPAVDTDPRGHFVVKGLPAGQYVVLVAPPKAVIGGHEEALRVDLNRGQFIKNVKIVYEYGYTISGHAQGDVGPTRGAKVTAEGPTMTSTMTDDQGNYTLMGLADGEYSITVAYRTCCTARRLGVAAGSQNVDFEMKTRGTIMGSVVDAITNAPIHDFEAGYYFGEATPETDLGDVAFVHASNPAGAFVLEWVESGQGTVIVRASGYVTAFHRVTDVPTGSTLDGVVVALNPGAAIRGAVVDATGRALSGAMVVVGSLAKRAPTWPALVAARTDEQGSFALQALPPGTATLSCYLAGYAPTSVAVTATPAGYLPTTITLTHGGDVEGTLRLDGQPLAGHTIHIVPQPSGRGLTTTAKTRADGSFSAEGILPGDAEARISLWSPSLPSRVVREISIPVLVLDNKATPLTVDIPSATGTLEGRVLAEGMPLEQFSASLQMTTALGSEEIHVDMKSDGAFSVNSLPSGQATLTVVAHNSATDSYTKRQVSFPVGEGEHIQREIRLASELD